jgi:hypothetical protein
METDESKKGAAKWLGIQLQGILYALHAHNRVQPFPAMLDIMEQGLFHVGYWCQQEEDRRARFAAKAKKEAGTSPDALAASVGDSDQGIPQSDENASVLVKQDV